MLYKEKCAVEKLCVDKQEVNAQLKVSVAGSLFSDTLSFCSVFQLIVSLERRIGDLNETLQEAGESYMEKLEEVQNLQNRLSNQVRAHTDSTYCMAMHSFESLFYC